MAKKPAEQQKTDAQRIATSGSGKLDQREPAPPPEPAPRPPATPDGDERAREREDGGEALSAARARIGRERQAAIDQLRELGVSSQTDETAPPAGTDAVLDKGDQAQASEQNDMAFMTRQRLAERINQLTAALERVSRGHYGRCADCGQPIEPSRLAALPETETCLACQERREARSNAAA
jgi:DnaK suppressor protein